MLAAGDKVLVALSGGPDSMCLLDVLQRVSAKVDLSLEVAHVDHGLSEEAEKVAARVAHHAAASGFEVHVVKAPGFDGPNLHARARDFRYAFFDTVASSIGATRIATGHTLDDRVETILARLIHGAPPETLAGIPPAEGLRIRPLIELRRAETRAYCDEVHLSYYDDPANEDPRYERVRVRTGLLALIEDEWGEGAVRAIARSAEHLRTDSAALDEVAARLEAQLARRDGDDVRFELAALDPVPRALRRRLLGAAVGRVRDRAGGIEAALDALESGPRAGASFAVSGGGEIVIESDHLVVRVPPVGEGESRLGSADEL
jgi:tRNA(Ile)-lysidine synthase